MIDTERDGAQRELQERILREDPEKISPDDAAGLAAAIAQINPDASAPSRWKAITEHVLNRSHSFPVHKTIFDAVYADRSADSAPAPAWIPDNDALEKSNLGILAAEVGVTTYADLHRWSVENRVDFWEHMVTHLGIGFDRPPDIIADLTDPQQPAWFPGAKLNIMTACFRHAPDRIALRHQLPGDKLRTFTYGYLDQLSNRVANSLIEAGYSAGDAIGIAMPMSADAVAAYLGIVKMGGCVVSVSETFSPAEIATRLHIAKAVGIVTQKQRGNGGEETLYSKVVEADAPRAIVLAVPGESDIGELREGDVSWKHFLSDNTLFSPVPRNPDDACNILFSSGTTGDPKAIPWTHTTPIKAAADAWLHHDVHPEDVIAWPTSLGWMMGPWLIFAAMINGASMAIYGGNPATRGMGKFVEEADVTVLGVVPSLVKSWRQTRCTERYDWSRIKAFSSTGECSNVDDMLYLMYLAGWKPVIEYCGGTEIGGGYITGTLVQPAAPATFSTPSMGLDVCILDDEGQPTDTGELFLRSPSIGLSNSLLNHDHDAVYYGGTPPAPDGGILRRHGDQMQRLPGSYFRSLGRADDTMNLRGIKVSSAELERIFMQVEGVRETAAIAVSPPGGGPSELVVYAVPEVDMKLETNQLKRAFQNELRNRHNSVFKVYDVRIVELLPRTASNKVMRRELRAKYECT